MGVILSFILGFLLIALGLLSIRDLLSEKIPVLKKGVEKIYAYAELIGIIGIIIGFVWILQAVSLLIQMDADPIYITGMVVGSLLTFTLSMMFGLPVLHKFMNEPTPGFLRTLDKWSAKLYPYRKYLGFVALALGILTLFS